MDVKLFVPRGEWKTLILLPCMPEEADRVWSLLGDCCALAAAPVPDWNRDLSPAPAPRVFRKGEDFAGGAPDFLRELQALLPGAEARLPHPPESRGLAGYSLAGLFALWAACRWEGFDRAASMSGSLWFPGMAEALARELPRSGIRRVYLSLGDREEDTRNPVMRTVGENTRSLDAALGDIPHRLVWEKGNHFQQPEERTARGIRALCAESFPCK